MSHGYVTPSTGFTIEVWFNRAALPTWWESLFCQYTQANAAWSTNIIVNGRQMWFGHTNGTGALYLNCYKENGTQVVSWTDPSPNGYESDGQWHHVAVSLQSDKTHWKVYLDGVLLASITGTAAVDWNPGIITVGGAYAPHLGLFGYYVSSAKMAMFAATNKELSANRIAEHYAAGAGGTVYYGDDEVTRLTRILDWTSTPENCRLLDDPIVTLQGIEVDGTNGLDAVQNTARAAGGYVFADGQSWIQYHNRRHRYNRFSLFTFAESLGSAVEAGVNFITDEEKIYNDVRGSRPYGGSYRMTDLVSVSQFGRKTFSFSLPITSAEDLRNNVGWLLSRYGSEHLRISGVTIRAESSALIEAAATGRVEIGDHIVLDELPDFAPVTTMTLTVEGLSLSADFLEKTWSLEMHLTPAEFDDVFEIGRSALGGKDKIAL